MNQLDRLEALAQRLIEGAFNRVFRSRPAPVQEGTNLERYTKTKQVLTRGGNDAAARWVLQVAEHQLRLGEPVVSIGRALDNDLVLPDPTVSRYHAQLRWREGRYHLFPPERSPGSDTSRGQGRHARRTHRLPVQTTLNGRTVLQSPLGSGDVLTLGETIITIVVEGLEA